MRNEDHEQTDEQQVHERYLALPKVEPPPLLDEKIIAAAHAELDRNGKKRASGHRAWYVPLSMAAVVLISFSLVLKLVIDEQVLQSKSDGGMPLEEEQEFNREIMEDAMPEQSRERLSAPAPSSAPVEPQSRRKTMEQAVEKMPAPAKKAATRKSVDFGTSTDSSKAVESASTASPLPAPVVVTEGVVEHKSGSGDGVREIRLKRSTDDRQREIRLRQMMELLEQGKYEKLQEELTNFRRRYPDFELPEALAEWENRDRPSVVD